MLVQTPTKKPRAFLPADFAVTTWEALRPWYDRLLAWEPHSLEDFLRWLAATDELQAVLQEDLGWRYIRMTCQTDDQAATEAYQFFLEHISPHVMPLDHKLQEKFYHSPYREQLDADRFAIIGRTIANQIDLYREQNVPLFSQLGLKAQQYGATTGAMTVQHDGQTYTLQQAGRLLEQHDRGLRETVWRKIAERRLQDAQLLDNLFDDLLRLRQQVAKNAGFDNYTDYKYRELGRFDYGRQACYAFHDAIEKAVVPLVDELHVLRKQKMGLESLRPWDLAVDYRGTEPLRPFERAEELIGRARELLAGLHPVIGQTLPILQQMGHLDVDSRVGKAPGGYNYPLHETGVPFIFMNAVGTQRDVTTLVHEAGHAIHSLVTRELPYNLDRDTPSEVAELASMSLELLSMEGWGHFYPNETDLRRAQLHQIVDTVSLLPWIATIDAFQHWLYDNPGHSQAERKAAWLQVHQRFSGRVVDYTGLEDARAYHWQRQLHLFEVPFYYIEYGIAQLGALQVWRNFLAQPQQALEAYLAALRLGYTQPIGKVYAAAGIRFDFSADMLTDLMEFVRNQLTARGFFAA